MDKLYRYSSYQQSSGGIDMNGEWERSSLGPTTHLRLEEYPVMSETKCGCWIYIGGWTVEGRPPADIKDYEKKWVSNNTRKRYAYPTIEEAARGFIARKDRQLKILKAVVSHAESARRAAIELLPRVEQFAQLFADIKDGKRPLLWAWQFEDSEVEQVDAWYEKMKEGRVYGWNRAKLVAIDQYMSDEFEPAVKRIREKQNKVVSNAKTC